VTLRKGEQLKAESDALITKSEGISIDSRLDGGFGKALARSCCTGESMFFQVLSADQKHSSDDENVLLAPQNLGSIELLQISSNSGMCLTPGTHTFYASHATASTCSES
jgi:uncharacterized protein (AIM24 family)